MLTLACVSATSPGCSDGLPASTEIHQAIMSGEESVPELDSVVRIEVDDAEFGHTCTGSLVAPNLVITAHHCLAELDERDGFACTIDGELDTRVGAGGYLGTDAAPSTVQVFTGVVPDAEPTAQGKQIIAPFSDTVCQNDIAMLVLDRDLDLPLLPLRLERATVVGEPMTMVGYGVNEARVASRRQRTGNTVVAVGPTDAAPDQTGSAPRTFMLGPGACTGDSGGPALSDETGAVAGVFSLLGGACGSDMALTTYTQVAPFAELIFSAFDVAGYEAVLEQAQDDPEPGSSNAGCSLSQRTPRAPSSPYLWGVAGAVLLGLGQRRRREAPAGNEHVPDGR